MPSNCNSSSHQVSLIFSVKRKIIHVVDYYRFYAMMPDLCTAPDTVPQLIKYCGKVCGKASLFHLHIFCVLNSHQFNRGRMIKSARIRESTSLNFSRSPIQSYDRRAMDSMYLYLVWCRQNQPHITPDPVDIINIFCLLFKCKKEGTNEFWVRLWSQLDLRVSVSMREYRDRIICLLSVHDATFERHLTHRWAASVDWIHLFAYPHFLAAFQLHQRGARISQLRLCWWLWCVARNTCTFAMIQAECK